MPKPNNIALPRMDFVKLIHSHTEKLMKIEFPINESQLGNSVAKIESETVEELERIFESWNLKPNDDDKPVDDGQPIDVFGDGNVGHIGRPNA